MESSTLTFAALDKRIEGLPLHPSCQFTPSRRVGWGSGVGFASALLGQIIAKTLPNSRWALAAVAVLLVIELLGFFVAFTAQQPGLNMKPSSERRELAETLDFDMPHHEELIGWLRNFPRERLQVMSDFTGFRVERLRSKFPLLTGGLDKLGILPILVALFIQFKDMHWPPQVSWPEVFLFVLLMGVYWLSLLQVGVRFRLELYDMLLKKALAT
ncbi:hypothetical protein ABQJ54_14815 [Rhodanobacter sp. Si-c]|uniref:Uncharacterized protein n=1 Tax=Rhodanobacter lycopersici TaxID=3162487 RepID=A0ABV3QHT4_9GAMM